MWELVRQTGDMLRRTEEAAFSRRTGVSHRQFLVLAAVDSASGPVTAAEIARQLGRNDNTVGAIIHRMVGQGLLRRLPSLRDERAALLKLTDAGKEKLAAGRTIEEALIESSSSGLSDSEIVRLCELLEKLKAGLEPDPSGS